MFAAALKQMIASYQELNEQCNNLTGRINELKDVLSGLRVLAGMDQVKHNLNNCILNLEQDRYNLIQMLQVLEKAAMSYSNCERRITDKYDQSAIQYQTVKVGFTDLNGLSNIISDIKFLS